MKIALNFFFFKCLKQCVYSFVSKSNLPDGAIKKVQKPYPQTTRFFCDPNGPGARSDIAPTSAHTVRPGDIDIVAAIGDSLTAGNGAFATNILQVFIENKGVSWSIGM